jgi:ABC-2 type transport system permease protein
MKRLRHFLLRVGLALLAEFRVVATSPAVLLVLAGGVGLYSVLYNLLYAPERVEGVPVVVVDCARTALTRRVTSLVDAAPEVAVVGVTGNYAEAREEMQRGEVFGVVVLPEDFESRLRRGNQAWILSVGSTTNFLNYEAVQSAVAGAMLTLEDELHASMAVFLPAESRAALTRPTAVEVVGEALYNPSHGYARYLLPPVLVIILFQTLMLAVGMTDAMRPRLRMRPLCATAEVVGRVLMWCVVYGVFAVWMLGFVPRLFGLPHSADFASVAAVVLPFLIATTLLALSFARLFSDPEVVPIGVAFFSVGLVFLSGVSYPLSLLPEPWHTLRLALPSSVATFAMVKVGSMGATAADCAGEIVALWIQCAVYGVVAVWVMTAPRTK